MTGADSRSRGEEAGEADGAISGRNRQRRSRPARGPRAIRATREESPVDLNWILGEVCDAVSPPDHIRVHAEGMFPIVAGDPTLLFQVFENLIDNAIKFMDKPQGEVRIGCEDSGDHWRFWVADNGPGIPEDYQGKVFELFQTLAPRDVFESTGVGLAVVRGIVARLGGRTSVESSVGQGSTFSFTLPKMRRHP